MTPLQCIAAISMLAVTACNNNRKQENPGQETPKALEDKAASYEIISKRGDDNLVDELYRELLKKDVDLKRLEENIGRLYDTKDDSTNSFARYQQKNMSYFASANMLVAGMKDSVLRDSIKLLVADQMKKYTARIAKQNELLKDIDAKQMTLEGSAQCVENRAHVTCNRSISTGAFAGDKPAGRFYQATGASHRAC